MLGKALTDAWAISRGPGLNRFPPPGVLLVAQVIKDQEGRA